MKKKLKWIVLMLVLAGAAALIFWPKRADRILLCRVEGAETVLRWSSEDRGDIRAVSRAIKKSLGPAGELPGDFHTSLPGYTLEGWDGPDTWAVWSGDWLRDQNGVCYPCDPDWDALTALLEPDSQASIQRVAELASMEGSWNTELMVPSDGGPAYGMETTLTEVRGSELWLRVVGTAYPAVEHPDNRLEVLVDGSWYIVPAAQSFGPVTGVFTGIEKGQVSTPVVDIDLICARYAWLPAGRYRVWAYGLTYEFTLD